jgi:hypothetical protein
MTKKKPMGSKHEDGVLMVLVYKGAHAATTSRWKCTVPFSLRSLAGLCDREREQSDVSTVVAAVGTSH